MSKRAETATFERLAFESALKEHPGDETAALVFRDWLMEHGYTPIGARREVTRTVREELERRQVDRLMRWCSESIANDMLLRSLAMRRCNTMFLTAPEIVIRRGSSPPTWTREGGFWRDDRGYEYEDDPRGMLTVMSATWIPVSESVTVGAGWVLSILFPPSKQPRQ